MPALSSRLPWRLAVLSSLLLGACAEKPLPFEQFLAELKPETVVPLTDFGWPTGTLLCPLSAYQNALHGESATAQRVNTFLQRSNMRGDEGVWSLVVVRPGTTGTDGIGQIFFTQHAHVVTTDASKLKFYDGSVPAGFTWQECVPVEHARVFVGRGTSGRISGFGVAGAG